LPRPLLFSRWAILVADLITFSPLREFSVPFRLGPLIGECEEDGASKKDGSKDDVDILCVCSNALCFSFTFNGCCCVLRGRFARQREREVDDEF
jgi:hypothetical protein